MRTHIKKAQLANKIIRLLHKKTTGKQKAWSLKENKIVEIETGMVSEVLHNLKPEEVQEILHSIFYEAKNTHRELVEARKERRRIRQRNADRIAKGWVPKKRTTKAEWEAKQILKIV